MQKVFDKWKSIAYNNINNKQNNTFSKGESIMTLGKLLENTWCAQEIEVRLKDGIDGDLVFAGEAFKFTIKNPDYEKYAKKRINIIGAYSNKLLIVLR